MFFEIIYRGRYISYLQNLIKSVFDICFSHNISLFKAKQPFFSYTLIA